MTEDTKVVGFVALVILALGAVIYIVVDINNHQSYLLAGGFCDKITEQWYQEPPQAHTSCVNSNCNTYFTQSDPYLRSYFKCQDHDEETGKDLNKTIEFWRRN